MSKVVAVHGIGQQFKGDAIIAQGWLPAIQSGLHLVGGNLTADDLCCPFYGHLFHPKATLAADSRVTPESLSDEERDILRMWWEKAAEVDPDKVISPRAYEDAETLVRLPNFVQRALNALADSPFWANVGQTFMLGDLRQVTAYMNDADVHDQIRRIVSDKITSDTRVVIGHSLGSVVAYESLCQNAARVVSFITLGSPLGIRNVIFEKLTPSPSAGIGHWPGQVQYWTNIADEGDVVALEKRLTTCFGDKVRDVMVNNGADAHNGDRYLITREAGAAIWEGLCVNSEGSP
jgi:hypothetical protein